MNVNFRGTAQTNKKQTKEGQTSQARSITPTHPPVGLKQQKHAKHAGDGNEMFAYILHTVTLVAGITHSSLTSKHTHVAARTTAPASQDSCHCDIFANG